MGGGYRSSQTDTLSAKQLVSRLAKRVVAISSRQMAPTNPPSDEKMEEKMEEEKKKQTTTKEKKKTTTQTMIDDIQDVLNDTKKHKPS